MLYSYNGKAPVIDESCFISDSATIIGDVVMGPGCYVGPNAVVRADFLPIRIGSQVVIEDGVIVHAGGIEKEYHVTVYNSTLQTYQELSRLLEELPEIDFSGLSEKLRAAGAEGAEPTVESGGTAAEP